LQIYRFTLFCNDYYSSGFRARIWVGSARFDQYGHLWNLIFMTVFRRKNY
jgi:hypothetical protein